MLRKRKTQPVKGEKHYSAKITEDDVREIRRLAGTVKVKDLAERYGIAGSNVSAIVRRKTWKHVVDLED